MNTPVALIIFNRPETTARVFAEIEKAKPRKLFIIADGPRPSATADQERCRAARQVVANITWDCEVLQNYAVENIGCGIRPATGISWVFEHVDEAIILEDDCIPHPSFFPYCEELLSRYRHDERIMHIAGNNFQCGQVRGPYSYFFSQHNICWGWATWKRAWKYFDLAVRGWGEVRNTEWLYEVVGDRRAEAYWKAMFEQAYQAQGDVDYWDYQWTFACWRQNGLSILPNKTLITNIGFTDEATHTKSPLDRLAYLKAEKIEFPLKHPGEVIQEHRADRFIIEEFVLGPRFAQKPDPWPLKVRRSMQRWTAVKQIVAKLRSRL